MTLSKRVVPGELSALVDARLSLLRVSWNEREELRQDILLWFLEARKEFHFVGRGLVAAVVRQFLRPHNRRQYALRAEGDSGNARPCFTDPLLAAGVAANPRAARLISSIVGGASWSEACDEEGIPQGSRYYWRIRLQRMLVPVTRCTCITR